MFPASVLLLMFTVIFMYIFDHYSSSIIRPEIIYAVNDILDAEASVDATAPITLRGEAADAKTSAIFFLLLARFPVVKSVANSVKEFLKSCFYRLVAAANVSLRAEVGRGGAVFAAPSGFLFLRSTNDSGSIDTTGAFFENALDTADAGVPYANIIIFFVVAFLIVSLLVGINWVVINFISNNKKNSPYECGFEPVGSPVSDFTPNFTAVALIFLIYDVEVLLTFP
jgi:hypothetical protein